MKTAAPGELRRDTRRRVRLEDLVPSGGDLAQTKALVNRLADKRLVVTTPRGEERLTEVEVAHEALIRHWPRLTAWLDENRVILRLRQGISEAAQEWERRKGREPTDTPGAALAGCREALWGHPVRSY